MPYIAVRTTFRHAGDVNTTVRVADEIRPHAKARRS
jgi:hypothetical protein